jgi:primase-polymerase (primpol)-like protein
VNAPVVQGEPPTDLRVEPRWVVWRTNSDGQKVPYGVHTSRPANVTDPSVWASYDEARAARQQYSGLGYVLGDGRSGVDLDDCCDANGDLNPAAQLIIGELDSYTEISPSGHGVKIFVRSKPFSPGDPDVLETHTRPGLEFYPAGRYFAVTGAHLTTTPHQVNFRHDELRRLLAREFGSARSTRASTSLPPRRALRQPQLDAHA